MEHPKIWFRTICKQNGLDVSDHQLDLLEKFVGLLLEWNKKINLISRKDEENIWESHILHSAAILLKLSFPENAKCLDIGTGGGLPGIPLKILAPNISITLLDSTQKKIHAVQDIVGALSLKDVNTVWGRAEEIGRQPEHRNQYDIVFARGVAELRDLVKWSKFFLGKAFTAKTPPQAGQARQEEKNLGSSKIKIEPPALIALKGGDLESEIQAAQKSFKTLSIKAINLTLQGSNQFEEGEKKIVVVEGF
ncbi:MAG: 16S rRNA (guanine(527)-N(7))-methyltransferase RsmG [Ignavibacteriales bacterium]|nr:16S rRNA (guanine(527)-N(7))-methyltransferase RsmG [Ignavibacteriales bacterium]